MAKTITKGTVLHGMVAILLPKKHKPRCLHPSKKRTVIFINSEIQNDVEEVMSHMNLGCTDFRVAKGTLTII